MAFIRITHNDFELKYNAFKGDTYDMEEWEGDTRIDEEPWIQRYQHEAKIVSGVINKFECQSVLEIGSGPGTLCKYVTEAAGGLVTSVTEDGSEHHHQVADTDFVYHMLDKKNAKKIKKYEQEMDRLEDEINTKLDKLWDDLIKRTGHDPGVFPTYHYSGKKRK